MNHILAETQTYLIDPEPNLSRHYNVDNIDIVLYDRIGFEMKKKRFGLYAAYGNKGFFSSKEEKANFFKALKVEDYTGSYFSALGAETKIEFRCEIAVISKERRCRGHVHFTKEKMFLTYHWDGDHMDKWKDVVIASLQLLKSWPAMTKTTPTGKILEQMIAKIKGIQ